MTIEPVGSCSTLITEQILKKDNQFIDSALAKFLHGKLHTI